MTPEELDQIERENRKALNTMSMMDDRDRPDNCVVMEKLSQTILALISELRELKADKKWWSIARLESAEEALKFYDSQNLCGQCVDTKSKDCMDLGETARAHFTKWEAL